MTNQERINTRLQALWASHSQYGNDAAFVMELANQMQTLIKEVREDSAQISEEVKREFGCVSEGTDCGCPDEIAGRIRKTGDL